MLFRSKEKKKEMPTTAARQSMDEPPPLRPPETNHHRPRLRSAAYQAAPSRRNATPTTLPPGRVLGFPRVRRGKWRMATTDTLQEGMVAPVGVTASVPAEPQGFLPYTNPTAQPEPTSQTTAQHHAPSRMRCHPSCLTTSTNTRPRRPERRAKRQEQQHQGRAGGNHLLRRRARGPRLRHSRGCCPDTAAGQTRPPLARP